MTEAEILAELLKADVLLKEYAEIVRNVLPHLADLKSQAVFGKPGGAVAHLGDYDAGIDTIGLSLTEEGRAWYEPFYKSPTSKASNLWDEEWWAKLGVAGIKNIRLGGAFV